MRGQRPSRAPGLVEPKHAGKRGAGLIMLEFVARRTQADGTFLSFLWLAVFLMSILFP